MILYAGTVAVLLAAAVVDVRKAKIPNILILLLVLFQTGALLFSQFVLNKPLLSGGEFFQRIIAAAAVFGFLYPFFKIGGLGAGDVKLITVTVLSVSYPLYFLLAVFAIGSVISLIRIIFKKAVNGKEKRVVHLALPILVAFLVTAIPLRH